MKSRIPPDLNNTVVELCVVVFRSIFILFMGWIDSRVWLIGKERQSRYGTVGPSNKKKQSR